MSLGGLKDTLNDRATTVLGRLGYSDQRMRDAKREGWWWLTARAGAFRGHGLFAGHGVVWTHPGRCELLPIEVSGPGPDEVTVQIVASVVSTGTERAMYTGAGGMRVSYPARPGYAAAGVVVAAGSQSGLVAGDRVAVAAPHASVVTVPARGCYPIPATVPFGAAAFTQLGVIARCGVNAAEIRPGAAVCVLGSGIVGSLALRLAVAAGAGRVTAVARSRRREPLARAGGADAFVVQDGSTALDEIGADVVIDATGDPQALLQAVAAVRRGGRIVLLGSPRGVTEGLPVGVIRDEGLTVVGAHISTLTRGRERAPDAVGVEARAVLAQLADGSLRVDDLVDLELDPREAPAFYRTLPGDSGVTAARFDWSLLPQGERCGRRSPLRLPDLSARGVGVRAKPLGLGWPTDADDPLAGASGMLRIALIGCGDIGEQNAGAIAQAPNARLVACFDPVASLADELAARHSVHAARSIDEILARDDVDAVFLAVPHDLHAPLAIQASRTGRHVIVEKPPAESLAAATAMAAAIRLAGVTMTVCFPHRYDAGVIAARRLIEAGALGELEGSLTTFLSDKPPSYWHGGFSGRATSDWRSSRARAGGGVLIMNLSHYVDLGLHLSGVEVEEVSAFMSSVDPDSEVEDTISVSIRYANGAVGSIFGGAAVPGTWEGRDSTELRLWGRDGHVAIEGGPLAFSLRGTAGLRAGRWHELSARRGVPLRKAFVTRFATALDRGTDVDVGLDDALAVQAFVEAAYRSAERGVPVRPADLLAEARAQLGPAGQEGRP
jgi:2-desacetyl-2-hydroxyethyl bacteriochlorophyllide A dehydrogenase